MTKDNDVVYAAQEDGTWYDCLSDVIDELFCDMGDMKEMALSMGMTEHVDDESVYLVGQTYYKGIAKRPDNKFVDAEDVINMAYERAGDDGGEWTEDYCSNITKEAKEELDSFLEGWFERNTAVNWFMVNNVTEHKLTLEDLV